MKRLNAKGIWRILDKILLTVVIVFGVIPMLVRMIQVLLTSFK